MEKHKSTATHRRIKTVIFRITEAQYALFSREARKRHMAKSELFRYLLARYFFDDKK